MCTEVHNMITGEEADCPENFAAMLGITIGQLIVKEGYGRDPVVADACLCQIDVPATLEENGWRYDISTDPMDMDAWPPSLPNEDVRASIPQRGSPWD